MTPLDIWGTEFTDEIIRLAKYRILDGGNLAIRRDLPKHSVKLALILVRILNPPEELSEAETAILMGNHRTNVEENEGRKAVYPGRESLTMTPLDANLRRWAENSEPSQRTKMTACDHGINPD